MSVKKFVQKAFAGGISRLSFAAIRGIAATYRFTEQMPHPLDGAAPGGYVLAIWHQNLFSGILAQTGRQHVVIVSRSMDADPIAYLCTGLGHYAARGSSAKGGRDKGGKQASEEMIEVLKTGIPGAITVDGPTGPEHVAKPGIVNMARRAGVPIVPYYLRPNRYWTFNSWDKFRLPKPGAKIDVFYGDPIAPPETDDREAFEAVRQQVDAALKALETAHPA